MDTPSAEDFMVAALNGLVGIHLIGYTLAKRAALGRVHVGMAGIYGTWALMYIFT